jgi:hypothetical protein
VPQSCWIRSDIGMQSAIEHSGRDSHLDGIIEYYTIFSDSSYLSRLALEAAPVIYM